MLVGVGTLERSTTDNDMNTYTDTQLKQALAKMLPELLISAPPLLSWRIGGLPRVLATELPHLCWLVEETLDTVGDLEEPPELRISQVSEYVYLLAQDYAFQSIHATWQQKVIALAKVKGVEIV